jgi:AraC-like DNA-binding protein
MKPKISLAATIGLVDAMKAAGGDPGQILGSLELDPSIFSNAEGFIPTSTFTRILEAAARRTGDDFFGLHFGEHYNPKDIGALAYVILNSPTILAAVQNAMRYLRVHNQAAKLSYDIEGERVYLRFFLTDEEIETSRQHNEFGMAGTLNILRMMAGSAWTPQEIQFAHASPAQTSEHIRIFRAPVVFGCAANALVFGREFLEGQVLAADRRLYPILKQYIERILSEIPHEDDVLTTLRATVAECMRDGNVKIARVAKKMALSPRTLQRRLREHGFEFKVFVDDTRRRFAVSYLRDRKNCLTEIAFLLGYSELSAFNRAFRRWTGTTPLDYRRRAGL